MIKVSVWVDADGIAHYRQSNRTIYNKRGTKYSIPNPKGGRTGQASDLALRADVMRTSKQRSHHNQWNIGGAGGSSRGATGVSGSGRTGGRGAAKKQTGDDIDYFRDAVEFGYTKVGGDQFKSQYGYGFQNRNASRQATGNRKKK
jgi:hypothetical protein